MKREVKKFTIKVMVESFGADDKAIAAGFSAAKARLMPGYLLGNQGHGYSYTIKILEEKK